MENVFGTQSDSGYFGDSNRRFRELASLYCSFAEEAGVTVIPYRRPELLHFSKLCEARKSEVIRSLEISVEICQAALTNGQNLSSCPSLTWQALRRLGLRPPSDLFSKITEESVIEIHLASGVQLFRNFNFYKYCSYSLEELSCESWNHLFVRDEGVFQTIVSGLTKLLSGEVTRAIAAEVPAHRVIETSSLLGHEVELNMLYGAPLFDEATGAPVATLVIESMKLLAAKPRMEIPEERRAGLKVLSLDREMLDSDKV